MMNPENISDLTSIPMPAAVTPESSAISFAVVVLLLVPTVVTGL